MDFYGAKGGSFCGRNGGVDHLSEKMDWWIKHGSEGRENDGLGDEEGAWGRWTTFEKA